MAEPCIGKGGLSNKGGWAGAAQLTLASGHEVLADRYSCDLKASKPVGRKHCGAFHWLLFFFQGLWGEAGVC